MHRYIILRRITKAKELLKAGKSAMEACKDSGFNDYSNFRKMFKKGDESFAFRLCQKTTPQMISGVTLVHPNPYRLSQVDGKSDRTAKGC